MKSINGKTYAGVLFDLDGTLIDHFQVIYRCYQFALRELTLPMVSYEKVKASVGGSITITFGKLIGEEYIPEAVRLFREEYDRIWKEDIVVLPGTEELLKNLKNLGIHMAVFTNKEGSNARKVLGECGLADYFDFILGTLDTDYRKPEKAFSEYALEKLGTSLEETCLIGDSPYDVAAAQVIGMDCYAVATGSHTAKQLRDECSPTDVFSDFYELSEKLTERSINRQPA